jgi:hypothetical protein
VFRVEAELAGLRNDPEAVEIVADVAYYSNMEISYLWAFTLWRLQAVFEGIITQSFLPRESPRIVGLAAKLRAVKAAGFALRDVDERALLDWAKLRNRLSHRPEWYYHEVWVLPEDAKEYLQLVKRILHAWKGGGDFLPYAPEMGEA